MADATVVTTTEYGLRTPDGNVQWSEISFDNKFFVTRRVDGQKNLASAIWARFKSLGLDYVPDGFVLVTREITKITSDVKTAQTVREVLA